MARIQKRPPATHSEILHCVVEECPACGRRMWSDYENRRTITTLGQGVVELRLKVRRCPHQACERYHKPYRPEAEGLWALPQHEFGLDIIALIGALRYQEHRTVSEIHQHLRAHGIEISARSVSNLLERYEELVAIHVRHSARLQEQLAHQAGVILAIDGMQPDVGHEVLWILRDCLSGEVLLARSLLSAEGHVLAALLAEVAHALPVPIKAVISDGQLSIRKAVASALPGVAHGLCHYHYLREATRLLYEADRHAKKLIKKQLRQVRPIERQVEQRSDASSQVTYGYCTAVRSALSDDGQPPLQPAGLRLQQRLDAIATSLATAAKKGHSPPC